MSSASRLLAWPILSILGAVTENLLWLSLVAVALLPGTAAHDHFTDGSRESGRPNGPRPRILSFRAG